MSKPKPKSSQPGLRELSIESWMRIAMSVLLLVALGLIALYFAAGAPGIPVAIGVNLALAVAFVMAQIVKRREARPRPTPGAPAAPAVASPARPKRRRK